VADAQPTVMTSGVARWYGTRVE